MVTVLTEVPLLRMRYGKIVKIHIERLPEVVYRATCDEIKGLVAQGRTLQETLEIARDVARKLLKAQAEQQVDARLSAIGESFDYPLVI